MKRKNRIYTLTHWSAYLAMAHGLLYLAIKYFFQVETPYGMRPHWSQSYLQSVHILLSPLFLFALGALWNWHILPKLRNSRRKRASGILLLATSLALVVSGYGIQALYQETAQAIQVWLHLVSGVLFVFVYLLHHLRRS